MKVGAKLISKVTGARGVLTGTSPYFTVKYVYKGKKHHKITAPEWWRESHPIGCKCKMHRG